MKCNPDDLETLVDGGMAPEAAAELQAHAAQCESCGEELRWLRSERELLRRRAAREPLAPEKMDKLWAGVESRLQPRPARWRPSVKSAAFSTAVAAAACLAFVAGRQAAERSSRSAPVEVAQAPSVQYRPVVARTSDDDELDRAEADWRMAASELEAVYQGERNRLAPASQARIDGSLARTRRSLVEARRLAGRDVEARLAVLDGYSEYVHSLHTVVSDLEVSR
jgi:hypothetical protein